MSSEIPIHVIGRREDVSPPAPGPDPSRRAVLVRRVRLLVAFTIAYNVIEAVVAIAAGAIAGSAALLGFGLDSVIEVSSALAVAWQFAGRDPEAREKTALRIIAFSFFGLAAFVSYNAVTALVTGHAADHSGLGIGIAALSLLVMPAASWIQRRTGNELGSHSAVADSKQTLLCTYMSAALLLGLLANSALGWWWADSAAALVIAALAVGEGVNAWRGDVCCSPAGARLDDHDGCGSGCACC
ncbi:cation transporter [Nocardioides sp. YJ-D4]